MHARTIVICLAAVASLGGASASALRLRSARPTATAAEVARLRAHFDSVDAELRGRDVSALDATRRARRQRLIAALREYRNAGVFPINTDFPGERVPYFVDHVGTRCAMAELIAISGRRDIVDRIALTRNNAYIHELTDDPALVAWLDSAGLSVEEAARIQPAYDGPICPPCAPGVVCPPCGAPDPASHPSSGYKALSGATIAAGLLSVALNSTDGAGGRWHEVLGFAAGATGLVTGATRWEDGGDVRRLGAANAFIGAGAITLATRHLLYRRSLRAARSSAAAASPPADRVAITLDPGIPGRRASPTLLVRVAF